MCVNISGKISEYFWLCLNITEFKTLIRLYCDWYQEGEILPYLKIVKKKKKKKKSIIFIERFVTDIRRGCEFACYPQYTRILNISRFWIYQSSYYTKVLNIPVLHKRLNLPEYLLIIPEYACFCLHMTECWTLIRSYCGRSTLDINMPCLKIVWKIYIYIFF